MTSQLHSLWATLPVMGVCPWMLFNAKPRKRHCCQQDRSLSPKKHGCIRVYSKCLVLEKANSHHTSRIKTGLPSGWKPHTSISSSPSPRNLIIYFLFLRTCLIQMFFISEVNDQWWFFWDPTCTGAVHMCYVIFWPPKKCISKNHGQHKTRRFSPRHRSHRATPVWALCVPWDSSKPSSPLCQRCREYLLLI